MQHQDLGLNVIETTRLHLIPCQLRHFEVVRKGSEEIRRVLGLEPVDGWLAFPEAMTVGYERLATNSALLGWWTYLFVLAGEALLIGNGGFVGLPDEEGRVEIGYAIAPGYQRRGLATEAASALTAFAFRDGRVQSVLAHTLPYLNPSVQVLQKLGMQRIGTVHDPEEGEVWEWSLQRDQYVTP